MGLYVQSSDEDFKLDSEPEPDGDKVEGNKNENYVHLDVFINNLAAAFLTFLGRAEMYCSHKCKGKFCNADRITQELGQSFPFQTRF